jgi:hypothetical protein
MANQTGQAPEQHDHVDATGVEDAVDEMEERVLGGPQDQVRHEDDTDAPAFDQDIGEEDPGATRPPAEPGS